MQSTSLECALHLAMCLSLYRPEYAWTWDLYVCRELVFFPNSIIVLQYLVEGTYAETNGGSRKICQDIPLWPPRLEAYVLHSCRSPLRNHSTRKMLNGGAGLWSDVDWFKCLVHSQHL